MLIACRCDAGLTQEELGNSIGVGSETYKRHERGETPFTIYEMFEIQKMLNERLGKYYTLDELFEMERFTITFSTPLILQRDLIQITLTLAI